MEKRRTTSQTRSENNVLLDIVVRHTPHGSLSLSFDRFLVVVFVEMRSKRAVVAVVTCSSHDQFKLRATRGTGGKADMI